MKRAMVSLALGLSFFLAHAAIAGAQLYISGYGGISFNRDTDVRETSATTGVTFEGVDVQNGRLFGGKLGYWGWRYFGFELDIYNFASDIPAQSVPASGTISGSPVNRATTREIDVTTTAITFNLLARYPIVMSRRFQDERFERRIEPYAGFGGGIFLVSARISALNFAATDTMGGFQPLVGLNVFLTRNLSAFGEYKFSVTGDGRFSDQGITEKFDLQSHHLGFGLSVHFR